MNDTVDMQRQARAWHRHLNQDITWIPVTGVPVRIAGMDPAWRHNAANWLLKRASHLAFMYGYAELHEFDEPIGHEVLGEKHGEPVLGKPVFVDVPDEVQDDMFRQDQTRASDPEAWVRTTTLYQTLVKDLPENAANLAKHWSTCDLRTGQAAACSCWKRHLTECPVYDRADITLTCHCRDNSPEWTL